MIVIAAFMMLVYRATPLTALVAIVELGAMVVLAGAVAWAASRRSTAARLRELSTRRTPGRDRAR